MQRREFAPAKINLTLEVLGRRPDGYHEIRSLTVFARDVGDELTLDDTSEEPTRVIGPFASDLAGPNLVDAAIARLRQAAQAIKTGAMTLTKNLPVASGIGGGSADAAAALRLIASGNPDVTLDLAPIARALGADVSVCLQSSAAMMTGIGEHLEAVAWSGKLYAVLANPLGAVPVKKTAQVFTELAATPLTEEVPEPLPRFATAKDVINYAAARTNDLEPAARRIFPGLDEQLAEMAKLPDNALVRLSGAGPTSFAVFKEIDQAHAAAAELARRHPKWWIKVTELI